MNLGSTTVGYVGPSVVLCLINQIQLIAAHRPHFGFPQLAGSIKGQSILVAMADAPYLANLSQTPRKPVSKFIRALKWEGPAFCTLMRAECRKGSSLHYGVHA
jgi:hypothetical protein